MQKLIDYLYRFERRNTYAIYGIDNDFGFGCMDKIAIAEDLGFSSEPAGVVRTIIPPSFQTVEDVESFPWQITLEGKHAQNELASFRSWLVDRRVHIGGGCFGPLTIASCIIGIENCLRMICKKKEVLHAVLRKVTDFMILLAKEEERLGADSFWIAEPLASLLSAKNCRIFCTPYIKEICDAISIPVVLHVCGKTDILTPAFLDAGIQALSIDNKTNLYDCLALVPEDVIVMGNVDPILLLQGSKEDVAKATQEIIDHTKNYKNFVMATGCQVPWDAPYENVEEMVELARKTPIRSCEEYKVLEVLLKAHGEGGEAAFALAAMGVSKELIEAAREILAQRTDAHKRYEKYFV